MSILLQSVTTQPCTGECLMLLLTWYPQAIINLLRSWANAESIHLATVSGGMKPGPELPSAKVTASGHTSFLTAKSHFLGCLLPIPRKVMLQSFRLRNFVKGNEAWSGSAISGVLTFSFHASFPITKPHVGKLFLRLNSTELGHATVCNLAPPNIHSEN